MSDQLQGIRLFVQINPPIKLRHWNNEKLKIYLTIVSPPTNCWHKWQFLVNGKHHFKLLFKRRISLYDCSNTTFQQFSFEPILFSFFLTMAPSSKFWFFSLGLWSQTWATLLLYWRYLYWFYSNSFDPTKVPPSLHLQQLMFVWSSDNVR